MKKILLCVVCVFFVSCSNRIDNLEIEDCGIKQVGENTYIKKLRLSDGDRIYFIVDREGKLISNSYTIDINVKAEKAGKTGKTIVTKSNFIVR